MDSIERKFILIHAPRGLVNPDHYYATVSYFISPKIFVGKDLVDWPDGSYGIIMSVYGCPQSYTGVWLQGFLSSERINYLTIQPGKPAQNIILVNTTK